MNKRTADKLHRRGVQAGRVVSFYHPGTKTPAPPVPEVAAPNVSVGDILRELVAHSEHLVEVVVLTKAVDGTTHMTSTLETPGDVLLFMKQIEHSMVRQTCASDSGKGPQPA